MDGSGIATLMKDAGLTNGAFYAHFASKNDLVAAVVTEQLRRQLQAFTDVAPGVAAAIEFVNHYLSPRHRDLVADGCPSAALLADIARSSDSVRDAYTRGMGELIDLIAANLAAAHGDAAHATACALVGQLYGTLQLARALNDPALSDSVLTAGVAAAQVTVINGVTADT